MTAVLDVAIIGAGFSGLGLAIQLKKSGIHNFQILERESEVGGTWWVNTYPGCACDVESHLYSFSFAPKHDWSLKFAEQPEISAYLKDCVADFELQDNIKLSTAVTQAKFDEAALLWQIETASGELLQSRFLVMATGGLSTPNTPEMPGQDTFQGDQFHSAQWNATADLNDKHVAVVGTGASAIQIIPRIADRVKSLQVFQRTPPWILPKADRRFFKWEHWLFKHLPLWGRLYRLIIYLRYEARALAFTRFPAVMTVLSLICRALIRWQVSDPDKRKAVTPSYTMGCKRVLISNDYYPALNKPQVNLVTTAVAGLNENSVVDQNGQEYPADVVIFSTGFADWFPMNGMRILGRNNVELSDSWQERGGPDAHLGTTHPGFPNFVTLVGPNTGLGHNSVIYMIESQLRYVLKMIRASLTGKKQALDMKLSVHEQFNDDLQTRMAKTVWATGCDSWYVNEQGKNVSLWPESTLSYRLKTGRFSLDHFELVSPANPEVSP